jgi:hypothetical protein
VPYFQGPRVEIALVLEVASQGEGYHVFRIDRPLGERTFAEPPNMPVHPY